jgi:hypothetical protein
LGVPAGAPGADSALGPLVICTADGAKAPPGDGTPDGLPAAGHCLACLLSVQPALAAALTAFAIAFPTTHTPRPQATGTSAVAIHLVAGGIHSTGPPHAA